MKKAVIYARYSSEKQTDQSIEGQIRVCKEYAKSNDLLVIKTYIDKAKTGTNDNRQQFQQMLKDSDNKIWDTILVYKLDRFSRNKYEMIIHRKELKDKGIDIVSAMENIPEGPEGVLLESLLEGMNQYYSEELAQKTIRGLKETLNKGFFLGKTAPYGYTAKKRKLFINPKETKIIQYIFKEYCNGKSAFQIRKTLNESNITYRNTQFKNYAVYRILKRKYYTGVAKIINEKYTNIYPKIISSSIFNKAQTLLKKNFRTTQKFSINDDLKNKLICGICGSLYVLKNKSRNSFYYICKNNIYKKCCKNLNIKNDILQKFIFNTIIKITKNKNFNLILNKILKIIKNKSKKINLTKQNLQNYFLQNIQTETNVFNNLIKRIIIYEDKIDIILNILNLNNEKNNNNYITQFNESLKYPKNIEKNKTIEYIFNKKIFIYV